MSEIKEWNECNNCIHAKVCEFKASREECVGQMNEKLDNIGYTHDFFEFSFECKEFTKQESNIKRDVRKNYYGRETVLL